MTMLTMRAVLLAKVEGTAGVDSVPTAALDAILVSDPNFNADPKIIERKFVRQDLSQFPHLVGRKLASITFKHELRSNGKTNTGIITDAAKLGRLLVGCGMSEAVAFTAAAQVGPVTPDFANPVSGVEPTWVGGGSSPTLTDAVVYTLTVLAGGITVSITNSNTAVGGAAQPTVSIVTATPIALGGSGLTITPTFASALTVGQVWRVACTTKGIVYSLISTGFTTLTLYAYFDGLLHKLTGAIGSFKITASAGDLAEIEFTFLGQYNATIDSALPSAPVYEKQLPSQVQQSNFTFNSTSTIAVEGWTFDQGNKTIPRPDINGTDGYNGIMLVDRTPSGGFNPEADLEAVMPFWAQFTAGSTQHWFTKVGTTAGNRVVMVAPAAQPDKLTYQDRDGLRTYENSLKFRRGPAGNDEYRFIFC